MYGDGLIGIVGWNTEFYIVCLFKAIRCSNLLKEISYASPKLSCQIKSFVDNKVFFYYFTAYLFCNREDTAGKKNCVICISSCLYKLYFNRSVQHLYHIVYYRDVNLDVLYKNDITLCKGSIILRDFLTVIIECARSVFVCLNRYNFERVSVLIVRNGIFVLVDIMSTSYLTLLVESELDILRVIISVRRTFLMITIRLTRSKLAFDLVLIIIAIARSPCINGIPGLCFLVVVLNLYFCTRYFFTGKVFLCEGYFCNIVLHLNDVIDYVNLNPEAFCSRNKLLFTLFCYLIQRAILFCQNIATIYISRNSVNSISIYYLDVIHRITKLIIDNYVSVLINVMSVRYLALFIDSKLDILRISVSVRSGCLVITISFTGV